MPDLRINQITPALLRAVKMAALEQGKTLRQFVLDLLAQAVKEMK